MPTRKPLPARLAEAAQDIEGCPHVDCRMTRSLVVEAAETLNRMVDLARAAADGDYEADNKLWEILDGFRGKAGG